MPSMRPTDQYQDLNQKQDQEHSALRAGTDENGGAKNVPMKVQRAAREIFKFAPESADIDTLVDTFHNVYREEPTPKRHVIETAIHVARLERRQRTA